MKHEVRAQVACLTNDALHSVVVRLNRSVTPRSCLHSAQQHNAAERASSLHLQQGRDARHLDHRAITLEMERAQRSMSIIGQLALATKREDIAAEEKEGTESDGQQTISIQAGCCSSAAVFPEQ